MSKPRLITKQSKIDAAPDRWVEQYLGYTDDKKDKADQLFKLRRDGNLTEQAIRRTVGNPSWTENKCDECDKDCETLVRIGSEPDYEARWLDLCQSCAESAISLFNE